jgi:hypothetical protein
MIARRRKRARVRSGSFRTLFWLVRVSAQFLVVRRYIGPGEWKVARLSFLALRPARRARHAAKVLRVRPELGMFP